MSDEEPIIVIDTIPDIKTAPIQIRRTDWKKVPKQYVEAVPKEDSGASFRHCAGLGNKNSEWKEKETILQSLAAALPGCSGDLDKSLTVLKMMCDSIEDIFKSGFDGANDKAIDGVSRYLFPGIMLVLREHGYYQDLKTFVGPEDIKADLAGSVNPAKSKFHGWIKASALEMSLSTVDGLTPLDMFHQLAGSIEVPYVPLRDLTQSAAEVYVLIAENHGPDEAKAAMLGRAHAVNQR